MAVPASAAAETRHSLPPEPESAPLARHLSVELAKGLMTPEQCSKLEMAVTEVVSNAIRHSRTDDDIVLALTPKDGYLCVRVTDSGPGLVPKPGAMATEPGAGYGLFLVEQLTRRWGMTREDDRTRVWFELDFQAAE
jgi:anti-sigma regulatory factor (Ser/Thr protein kinase)